MQIKKGKYTLNSDKSCYWISEIKTSKQGTEYEVVVSGYHRKMAVRGIEELVQVAAMCDKTLQSLRKEF